MQGTPHVGFPVVRAAGPPTERGRQYGTQARLAIEASIAGYEKVFAHYAGWDWATVRAHASRFSGVIGEFSPASLAEMRGIADGAGLELADILALNTRSEIMFAARNQGRLTAAPLHECTSFAVLPERSATLGMLAGQNWDWLLHAGRTALVLEVTRTDAPSFLTVVEAGLLAKVGVNEAGVGLCTNTLISDGDEGRLGVPYHLLLRAALDSGSGEEAAAAVTQVERASSANYLIVDSAGFAADIESAPVRDGAGARRILPSDGRITHANHFVSAGLTGEDLYLRRKPHSLSRLRNVTSSLDAVGTPVSVDELKVALADHRDLPASVCQHPDVRVHPRERTATLAGVIMEVDTGTMHIAAGQPCQNPWQTMRIGRAAG
jgi:isopenicillin-N N-acyltransferase like protein